MCSKRKRRIHRISDEERLVIGIPTLGFISNMVPMFMHDIWSGFYGCLVWDELWKQEIAGLVGIHFHWIGTLEIIAKGGI